MTHKSRKWLRCGESICFPLTDSVPVARRKNNASAIPDRSPVWHPWLSSRQPQLRRQFSPGSHPHTADACSPPGPRSGAAVWHPSRFSWIWQWVLPACSGQQLLPPQLHREIVSSGHTILDTCTCVHPSGCLSLTWLIMRKCLSFVLHCINHTQYSSCINHCTEIKKEVCTHTLAGRQGSKSKYRQIRKQRLSTMKQQSSLSQTRFIFSWGS